VSHGSSVTHYQPAVAAPVYASHGHGYQQAYAEPAYAHQGYSGHY
jgi:hypothetical protein